ncbi:MULTISPECIES: LysR family transcriptional regulator [unclassified Nocardiopsis]|uniref:LysR family transcriptional regulator n=1 Tax=Nocardiopsis TaxID=2013 RepID=UPI00387B00BC
MSPQFDLVHLRTFVAIADCGGFGRAASVLRTSQPSVSQHVRALERAVGRPLVERSGRSTRFTPAGEALLAEARCILAVHDAAVRRLAEVPASSLTFGATEHAADHVLPTLLTELRPLFPGRDLVFRLDRSTELAEDVGRGALDLALILGSGSPVGAVEVGALPLLWLSSPDWSLHDDGDQLSVVAFQEPCNLRQQALRALEVTGRAVRIAAEATNLEGVLAAARAGLGVALLPVVRSIPAGLVRVGGLPEQGSVPLRLAARRGLDPEPERVAATALRRFFRDSTAPPVDGLARPLSPAT